MIGNLKSRKMGVEPIGNRRFFVVWVGTNDNPVDMPAASALAESIRV
jgi:hypothetical protein